MKIFNIENGTNKLYVQKEDLMNLCDTTRVPQSIYEKYKYSFIDSNNLKDFIEFSDPVDIEYLNNIDWIIDYREYSIKLEDELTELARHYETKINDIALTYNDMSKKERIKNYPLKLEHDHLTYKYYSILNMIKIKKNIEKIDLPKVADYKGFTFEDAIHPYILKTTLDNNIYIIERKDNKPITPNENVPKDFIDECMHSILFYRTDTELLEEFSITNHYNKNGNNLIIKIDIVKTNTIETEPNIIELKNNDSTIKKLINKFTKKD